LENYSCPQQNTGNDTDKQDSEGQWVKEVRKDEGHAVPSPGVMARVPSWRAIVNTKGELSVAG